MMDTSARGLSRLHVVSFCKILFSKPSSFSVFPLPPSLPFLFCASLLSPSCSPPHTGGCSAAHHLLNSLYLEHPSSQTGVHVAPLAPLRLAFPRPLLNPRRALSDTRRLPTKGPAQGGPGPQALKEPQR